MGKRKAAPVRLDEMDAARIKGMLLRGDRQSDIAAYHAVNQGRIMEINGGTKFRDVAPMHEDLLPPRGPYVVVDRVGFDRAQILARTAKEILDTFDEIASRMRSELSNLVVAGGHTIK